MTSQILGCLLGAVAVTFAATPSAAAACLSHQSVPPTTAGQTPAPPASPPDKPQPWPPLVKAGWSYSSLLGNEVVANIHLSHGRNDPTKDQTTWRGPQVSGAFGTKGFEVGAGYGKFVLDIQVPIGYEFRAVGGQVREQLHGLAPQQWFAGGEAAVMLTFLRLAAGLVVPVGTGTTSHTPVVTGSIGIVVPLVNRPAKKK